MKSPYGLKIIESCLACNGLHNQPLCGLGANCSPEAVRALDVITFRATYPKGAQLFVGGQPPRGEILGVPGTISERPHSVTAEVLEPAQAGFIPRDLFLRLLAERFQVSLPYVKKIRRQLLRTGRMERPPERRHGLLATVSVESPTDGDVFLAYLEHVLCPQLQPGQVVVMDNLSAHKVAGVRQRIEATGAELRYLPSYSTDQHCTL